MRKHFKSRFPAFNIPRQSEEVATDTIFSDTPANDSGVLMAQITVGKQTLVTDVYPLKSPKQFVNTLQDDRIPSTTPGAEPPRDARDSGSARSHSTHLETSSSDRPKWSPTRSSTRYQDQISVKCTRRTLRMPRFTRAAHAQPSLSNFPRRDLNFGEPACSRGTAQLERNFPPSPQNKKTKLTHCSIYVPMRTISTSHAK